MGKRIVMSLVLVLLALFGYSEAGLHPPTLNTPWAWNITSSFGPRISSGTYFHEGIDYGGVYGTSIRAIEDGYITEIGNRTDRRGYYITYRSNRTYPENGAESSRWDYFHMFSNASTLIPSTKWEFATDYKFINSKDTSKLYSTNTIIKWFDKSTNKAEQVLCAVERDGYFVKDSNGVYILNSAGQRILAKGRITGSDYLGPVGCSSTGTPPPPHLHVALNNKLDNPLFYLSHRNHGYTPNTDAGFTIPANSIIASPVDDLKYRITIYVVPDNQKYIMEIP